MESKNQKLAEELAKLAIVKATEQISALTLMGLLDVADHQEEVSLEDRVTIVALAKKIAMDAVDASGWVVDMTMDKMEPFDGAVTFYGGDGQTEKPMLRLHFAFGDMFETDDREAKKNIVLEIGSYISDAL